MSAQDPVAIRDAARDILADPKYHTEDRGLLAQLYHYLIHPLEAINDGWSWLLSHIPWGSGGIAVVAWLVVVLIVVVAVVLLVGFSKGTMRDAGVDVGLPRVPQAASEKELLARARAYEAQGEWKFALRARYGALIARLAEGGIVVRRPGRTTGEYVREVSTNAPVVRASFARATEIFEWAWYGNADASEGDVAEFRRVADEVKPHKRAA